MKKLAVFGILAVSSAFASDRGLAVPPTVVDVPATLAVSHHVSDHLVLRLPAIADAGYSWRVVKSALADPMAAQVKPSFERPYPGMVDIVPKFPLLGGSSVEVLEFPSLSEGQHRFELVYGRPWESEIAQKLSLSIDVQKDPQ